MEQELHSVTYLSAYKPAPFVITEVELRIELHETKTHVCSSLKVERNPVSLSTNEALVLNGESLELVSVKLNDKTLSVEDYLVDEHNLTIHSVPDKFCLEIENAINPTANTALNGLYLASNIFCTQCEPEGFRKITYFLDRPDVMAVYTTTLVADKKYYPILLANGNLIEQGETNGGQHWVKWHDPFKKPSYLFAIVGGDFAVLEDSFVTQSKREVKLKIFVKKGAQNQCLFAMESLKRAMLWDEKAFGRECDLDHYNIVATDDFNMGAMENKGLNVFNSKYIFASEETATDQDFINIQSVVGHEYFHNWTGNRITCRDWFQLSLKEGLTIFREQEFDASEFSESVLRINQVKLLRARQFPQDAGPMAHPVQPQSYIEISNFYTVTIYQKGGEIARMLQTLLGKEGFRRGMDWYFQHYDGMAVTIEEFIHAMEEGNSKDLSQFRRWYHQAGTPEVYVTGEYDNKLNQFKLTIKQYCPPTPEQIAKDPFHIPLRLGLLDLKGKPIQLQLQGETQQSLERVLEITQPVQEYTFVNVSEYPTPSLLRGFSAPVKLNFPYTDYDLLLLLEYDTDPFGRWEAMQQILIRTITRLVNEYHAHTELILDEQFIKVFEHLLKQNSLDPWYLAELLTFPSETYIAQFMPVIDPGAIHIVASYIQHELAHQLHVQWFEIYHQYSSLTKQAFSADVIGKRALKNLSLHYLLRTEGEAEYELAYQQFLSSNSMTDVLAALTSLSHFECAERKAALEIFFQKWQNEPLLVDVWFAIQARSELPNTLYRVEELTQHPLFNLINPNRVRALIGTFVNENPACFHAEDGAGYKFLSRYIQELDPINPHISARLCEPFTQWQHFDENRQHLMQKELKIILAKPGLSKETYEMVSKSLGEAYSRSHNN